MRNHMRLVGTIVVAMPLLALGACATSDDVNALRSEVQQARAAADKAAAEAAEARRLAEQANRRSSETDEKVDRMFQRSLRK